LKQRAHKEAKVISDAQAVADALKNIEIVAKAGGLFGSITNIIDIAAVLAKGGQVIENLSLVVS
jgi:large subunit ribosomal protein L9